jgi:hypothetical protein
VPGGHFGARLAGFDVALPESREPAGAPARGLYPFIHAWKKFLQ